MTAPTSPHPDDLAALQRAIDIYHEALRQFVGCCTTLEQSLALLRRAGVGAGRDFPGIDPVVAALRDVREQFVSLRPPVH